MDFTRPVDPKKLLTLSEAAQRLAVSVDVLLKWNESNILKPTITPTGEVGYREEQINQFLGIRQVPQHPSPQLNPFSPVVKHDHNVATNNYIQKDYSHFHHTKFESPNFPRATNKYLSIGPVSAAITLGIALVVILITQPTKIKSLLDEANSMGTVLASQISVLNITGSTASPSPIQLKNSVASDKNLKNEGAAILADRFATLNTVLGSKSARNSGAQASNITPLFDSNLKANNITYGETTNFASGKEAPNSVFDNNGNIKGKTTNTDVLAAAIDMNGMVQNGNPIKQTVDLNMLLIFFSVGSLFVFYVFKRQFAYSTKRPVNSALGIDPHNFISDLEEQRILEIDQKTDGTVVLCFQGKEYKVSKPELDSESDQFIERLMSLIQPNVKEIDYDNSADQEIRLSAPLSKLVTRLGFVGIKRDLFFPRTSKNRVLFRKYLTKKDLISMNLTTEQISSEFLSFPQG